MKKEPLNDEKQRRLLQEYIFNLEDAQEKTEELALTNEKLNQYGHYLEKLVAARTDELIKANEKLQQEINERKQKEKELLNLEELESSILDAIPHAVFGLKDRNIVFANKGVKNVFGWEPEELLGKSSKLLYSSDEEFEEVDNYIYPTLEQQKTSSRELDFQRKDGTKILCRINIARIGNNIVEKNIVAIIEDITDYRHAEKEKENLQSQLLQAQKLEAVGKLAGGIAHDFNNILSTIIGCADIIQLKMPEDDPLRSYVDHIVISSQKAANLTKSLLAFSRKQIMDPKPLELNRTIFKMGKFLSRLIPEDVELRTNLYNKDLVVLADAGQIDQVIMNLVTNARDSLSDGGIIEISVGKFLMNGGFKETHGYGEPGEYAMISLADNGAGMDGEIVKKIFEPFFTTKEVGKGTGLGLSIAYGIIKQHGGYIEVQSEPNQGTIFNIYLPLIDHKIESTEKPKVMVPQARGSETVLIVEDNDDLRMLLKDILEQYGYRTREAVDGVEAITEFYANIPDLVILDVIMPGKNGREVYDEICKTNPDMKFLFISGYTADVISRKGIIEDGYDFISKPFQPTDLLRKVRSMLTKT